MSSPPAAGPSAAPNEALPRARPPEAGLRAILLYKTVKATAGLTAALVLGAFIATGHADSVRHLAELLRHHATHAWAVRAADALIAFFTPHHVALGALALTLDGSLTALEAWALRKGRPWGEWLVVAATGVPLPYEALELAEHVRAVRALVLLGNLAVVAYLVRRALRRRRQGEGGAAAP